MRNQTRKHPINPPTNSISVVFCRLQSNTFFAIYGNKTTIWNSKTRKKTFISIFYTFLSLNLHIPIRYGKPLRVSVGYRYIFLQKSPLKKLLYRKLPNFDEKLGIFLKALLFIFIKPLFFLIYYDKYTPFSAFISFSSSISMWRCTLKNWCISIFR